MESLKFKANLRVVNLTDNKVLGDAYLKQKDLPYFRRSFGAEDGARTRSSLLGRQVLYQLSYFRNSINLFNIKNRIFARS